MSDPIAPTTQPPAANDGNTQQGQPPAATPPTTPAAAQPYRAFADQQELDAFVKTAKGQAERAGIRKLAKDLGFEDVDEMREALGTLRQAQGGTQPAQPGADAPPSSQGPSESARLSMALTVGAKLNLPAALIGRLQGATPEEMEADAQVLLGLMSAGQASTPRPPGIPAVPAHGQPVTFTRTQLQDAKFVREHQEAIRQAYREGRIVNS